jgi:broad specificity phosphatase PhoE
MTHIALIHAGPTPWDDEDRVVGNSPLPLTDQARETIRQLIPSLGKVTAIYRAKKNEACDEAAKIIAEAFKLKPRDNAALDEFDLGLWQGLTRSQLQFRFSSAINQWKENPLAVIPPDGEPLADEIERIRSALKAVLRKNLEATIVLPLRPLAMRTALGLLRGESPQMIAGHLQSRSNLEKIDFGDDELYRYLAAPERL